MSMSESPRTSSYGELGKPSILDRLGVWLSERKIASAIGTFDEKRIGDFGCGFQARITVRVLPAVSQATVVDVSLSDDLKNLPKVTALEGRLPTAMVSVPDGSIDVTMCNSVLEHLDEPDRMLAEMRRVTAPGGVCIINVPTWFGKRFLEYAAFRIRLAPEEEMDDHKTYYDPKDLWPKLVQAGFVPHNIRCHRHKFGMNTFAVCKVDP